MTDHHPQPTGPPPTARQQRYLRRLAPERGMSSVPPRTRSEASGAIDQLLGRAPDSRAARRRAIRAVQDGLGRGAGDAARVRQDEVSGYGSTATWKGRDS